MTQYKNGVSSDNTCRSCKIDFESKDRLAFHLRWDVVCSNGN